MSDHLTLAALGFALLAGFLLGRAWPRKRFDPLSLSLWQAKLDTQINEIVRLERENVLERGRNAILQRERRDHYGEAIAERRGTV